PGSSGPLPRSALDECEWRATPSTNQAFEITDDYFESPLRRRGRPAQAAARPAKSAGRLPAINHTRPPLAVFRDGFAVAVTRPASLMRIAGPNVTAGVAPSAAPRRTSSGGFSIAEQEPSKSPASVASLRTIGG